MARVASPTPLKIAIVGGGCGALSAAFALSRKLDERGTRHDVTVYQMGWRLGGKGASGRNAQRFNRTEEHGLHVWMGFYENAFRLMRECYAELPKQGRQSRYGDWQEAFMPDHWVGVADESRGAWRIWSSFFPATLGLPGDPLDPDTNPFSLTSYLTRACDLLRALIYSTFAGDSGAASSEPPDAMQDFSDVSPRAIVDKITGVLRSGVLSGAAALYEAMSVLQVVVSGRFTLPNGDYLVLQYAEAISANLRRQAKYLFATDETFRPKLELVELVVTVVVGILRDQLLSDPEGLDAVNDEDCRVWLRRHGASESAVQSSIVRALYDMAFADEKVDRNDEPGLAAGQALRGALRMFFTYRGSMFWKLRAGMGDVVFSPLYEVLKLRGVKFKFFHELTNVKARDGRVSELHFHVQAQLDPSWRSKRTKERGVSELERAALEAGEYYPLDEDGCWPAQPLTAQLQPVQSVDFEVPLASDAAQRNASSVRRESDFDCVVLGVAVGALPSACPELVATDQRFAVMCKKVKTVPTQALQLWLTRGLDELTPSNEPITVAGFVDPFDTWSDMTHVIAEERWPGDAKPQGLVYFCGALSEEAASDEAGAKDEALAFLERSLPLVWPNVRDPKSGGFRWELLAEGNVQPTGKHRQYTDADKDRLLNSQFYKRNVNPSDRYVLTRPSSTLYRISPLDSGYENMTIAGDWTDCGFNEGCVEAAVMSGLLAAHAISRHPALEDIIGFDHP